MKVTTISANDLSQDQVAAWNELQTASLGVDSPFFRPEFTRAVASVRDDVEVGVLEHQGECVGFFPFQRYRSRVGLPVGGRLCDFQGIVLKSGIEIEPMRLIQECQLSTWYFDHLVAPGESFAPFVWSQDSSPYIDLSDGFDTYIERRRAAGCPDVMQALSKKKRTERQVGPLRFVPRTTDDSVLEKLFQWKVQQYSTTQVFNVFTFSWTTDLIRRLLHAPDSAEFAGTLSAMYVGDHLAAAHFGMRSGRTLHWWFPAYNPELSKYSPGAQLLLELTRAAPLMGIDRIDLGKGSESYKLAFMTGATPLGVGSVDTRTAHRAIGRLWHHTRRWIRDSPLRGPASMPGRFIQRVRDQIQFR